MRISIAKDFTVNPGPRYTAQGPYSGQDFRENMLKQALKSSIETGEELIVDLDGSNGYGYSFLEEAFGGLVRSEQFTKDQVLGIVLVSNEEPHWIDKIESYIKNADSLILA